MQVIAVSNEFSKEISQESSYKWKEHFYLKTTGISMSRSICLTTVRPVNREPSVIR